MKKTKFFAMMLLLLGVFAFSSCSDDDDDNGGTGSASLKVNNTTVNLNNVYWTANDTDDALEDGEHFYQIEFYTFDYYALVQGNGSIPNQFSAVLVSFHASGSLSELPSVTIPYGKYEVSGGLNMSRDDEEGDYIEEGSGSGNLVITENNGKYTITINPLNVLLSETSTYPTSLSYSGSIKKVPTGLEWD